MAQSQMPSTRPHYEQGKVHHVGAFPELEDELCTWVPGASDSPDRLDALVWAFTELAPGVGASAHAPVWGDQPRASRWASLRPGSIFGGV
jgi:hypothetical protein